MNKPEIDLPASISSYDLRVYERGARCVSFVIRNGGCTRLYTRPWPYRGALTRFVCTCLYTKQTYRNLQEFIARGWLAKDERPSYYIYAQRMGDHLQVRKRAHVVASGGGDGGERLHYAPGPGSGPVGKLCFMC